MNQYIQFELGKLGLITDLLNAVYFRNIEQRDSDLSRLVLESA